MERELPLPQSGAGKPTLSAGHVRPTLDRFGVLHNFTVESQVQYHAPLAFTPITLDNGERTIHGLTQEDLTVFVNSAEWTLCAFATVIHARFETHSYGRRYLGGGGWVSFRTDRQTSTISEALRISRTQHANSDNSTSDRSSSLSDSLPRGIYVRTLDRPPELRYNFVENSNAFNKTRYM